MLRAESWVVATYELNATVVQHLHALIHHLAVVDVVLRAGHHVVVFTLCRVVVIVLGRRALKVCHFKRFGFVAIMAIVAIFVADESLGLIFLLLHGELLTHFYIHSLIVKYLISSDNILILDISLWFWI